MPRAPKRRPDRGSPCGRAAWCCSSIHTDAVHSASVTRILVVEPVAQPGLDALAAAHETEIRLGLDRSALLGAVGDGGGWDALVVRSQTRVDGELLAAAPRLSVVGVASIGIDRIDVDAATRAGVMVVNAPTGNTIAAAEHTVALMLA